MKNEDVKKRIYVLAAVFVGVLVQTLLLSIVWIRYYNKNDVIQKIFVMKGHVFILILYGALLFGLNRSSGSLKIGYLKVADLIFSQIVANIFVNIIFYLELCLLAYGFPNPKYLLWIALVQNLFNIAWCAIISRVYSRIFPPHQVLLLFGNDSVKEFLPKLGTRKDKFKICESIKVDVDKIMEDPRLCDVIKEKIKRYNTVMLWDIPTGMRNELFKYAYGEGIRIYVMPKISDIILTGSEPMHFFDSPLLLTRSHSLTLEQRILKRLCDIVLSLVLIIITSPLMLLVALAIKLYDGGSILYKQVRCTLNNKEFQIYKFRSMVENAEKDGVARLAEKSDNRITPIGKFLRITRLDELPQLMNILKGEMSFVGPRPERPPIIKKYCKEIPEFAYRTKLKAGLTGYAQIFGKYNTTPYDKLKLDMYYIEHFSVRLDISLMIQTIKIMFTLESTEGVEKGNSTASKRRK